MSLQGRIQGFPKGGVETRNTKCGGGVGGGGGGCCPLQAQYEKQGGGGGGGCCPFKARYEKRGGGGGGGGGSASDPIQNAGKGEGLFSRRGGVTIYERGGKRIAYLLIAAE